MEEKKPDVKIVIRKYMDELALTWEELEQATGICVNNLRRYEAGTLFPKSQNILTLCKALDIAIEELFGREPVTNPRSVRTADGGFIGGKIKILRKKAQLKQPELASLAGISEETVSHLERGLTIEPTAKTLVAIADALAVPIGTLFPKKEKLNGRD